METKKCSKCLEEKYIDLFCKSKNRKDGLNIWCKLCVNKDYKPERRKIYRDNNKDKNKEWRLKNKEIKILYDKLYSQLKKEDKKLYDSNYRKYKYKTDYLYKIKTLIYSSIVYSFKNKNINKNYKTKDILGCSFEEFKQYIEIQFKDWMCWENHGLYNGELDYGWDLDHIIPISSAKTEEDIIRLNHHTNFQPLCSKVNRDIKKDKIWNKKNN